MVQTSSTITLSSLYSSGQCLLSVLGSIGVILLFAGIPQLIYAPQVNPGSLMTFLLGALLISLMVAGNAFIGYKYRQLVRGRREETRQRATSRAVSSDDKPPSYDDLLQEEGLPPAYASIIKEKPPRYEELVTEVFNWQAIAKVPEPYRSSETADPAATSPSSSSDAAVCVVRSSSEEMPIIIPIQRHLNENSKQSNSYPVRVGGVCLENPAFQSSVEDIRISTLSPSTSKISENSPSQEIGFCPKFTVEQLPHSPDKETTQKAQFSSSSSVEASNLPSIHVVGQKRKPLSTESSVASIISLEESLQNKNTNTSLG